MKKLFYLLVITLFISSCSTTNFVSKKKDFNGNKLTFAHKDVQKTEVEPVKKTNFTQKQQIKSSKSIALQDENKGLKPLKRAFNSFKTVSEKLNKSSVTLTENIDNDFISYNANRVLGLDINNTKKTNQESLSSRGSDILGILAFIFGILGILTFWTYLGLIFIIPAIILGFLSDRDTFGRIGLILGFVGLGLFVLIYLFVIVLLLALL